jgi:RsiW-degrading membrane proteinase PrsW (M82 family)
MTLFLFLSGVVAPTLFWILYFYYKDRYQPEPVLHMGFAYILGFASAWLCFKSYGLLPYVGLPEDASIIMDNNRLEFLIYSLGVVGPLEEFLKFLPYLIVIFYFKPFDEKKDGIIYASVIALGFASYENLHYLVYLEGFELFGRAIASPLTHGIFSSIWGYMVGAAKLTDRSILKAALIGLAVAAVFHGLFNFFTTSMTHRIGAAVVILGIWIWRLRKIDKLDKKKGK